MTAKQSLKVHPHVLATGILLLALLATWAAYAPGLGGSLHFDDQANLGGLSEVDDTSSAIRFAIGGVAGPLGRPLSLASFTPQAYAWPDATDIFLRTNILIHLLNGALVTWFLYLLGRARRQSDQKAALIAAGAGALWMLMPLLASSSLFIVQRMTTLAALFTISGMIAYLYARRGVDKRFVTSLIGMTLALGLFGAIGAFAKENGALVFLFVLAMESTLLDRPARISRRAWRTWFSVVLLAPLLMLIGFLLTALPYPEDVILRRDFSGFERLITQAGILWQYLYLAFIPDLPSIGPFHDDYVIQRTLFEIKTLLSVVSWFLVIFLAFKFRGKAPLFGFAVAWFLLGHLLESTTYSLELYFEHRNYLPLVGPVYALVASLGYLSKSWLRIATVGAIAYASILASLLFSTATLWGSPALAAEMWHIYKPDSLRAAQQLAGNLERQGDPFAARRLLERFIAANPDENSVRIQLLALSCVLEPENEFSETISLITSKLSVTGFNYTIPNSLIELNRLLRQERCPNIEREVVYEFAKSVLRNPRFTPPVARHNIHTLMATISVDQRDFGRTMVHMEEALRIHRNPYTLMMAIDILNSGGRFDLSRELMEDARRWPVPRHPLRALRWETELTKIEEALVDEKHSR